MNVDLDAKLVLSNKLVDELKCENESLKMHAKCLITEPIAKKDDNICCNHIGDATSYFIYFNSLFHHSPTSHLNFHIIVKHYSFIYYFLSLPLFLSLTLSGPSNGHPLSSPHLLYFLPLSFSSASEIFSLMLTPNPKCLSLAHPYLSPWFDLIFGGCLVV